MKNRIIDELAAAVQLRERQARTAKAKGLGQSQSDKSMDPREFVRRQWDRSRQAVEHFAEEHSAIYLGIALAAGLALGWWIKRR